MTTVHIGGDTAIAVVRQSNSTATAATASSLSSAEDFTMRRPAVPLPSKPEYIRMRDFDPKIHLLLDEYLSPIKAIRVTQCLEPAVELQSDRWPDAIVVGYDTKIRVGVEYCLTVPMRKRRHLTPSKAKFYQTEAVDAVKLVETHAAKKSPLLVVNNFTPNFNIHVIPTNPPEPTAMLKFVEGYVKFTYNLGYIFGAFARVGTISGGSAIFTFPSNLPENPEYNSIYDMITITFPFIDYGHITRIGNMTIVSHAGLTNLLRLFRQVNGDNNGKTAICTSVFPMQFRTNGNIDYVKGVLDGLLLQHSQPPTEIMVRFPFTRQNSSNMEEIEYTVIWCCEILGIPYKIVEMETEHPKFSHEIIVYCDSIGASSIVDVRQSTSAYNMYCVHIEDPSFTAVLVSGGQLIAL